MRVASGGEMMFASGCEMIVASDFDELVASALDTLVPLPREELTDTSGLEMMTSGNLVWTPGRVCFEFW